MTATTERPAQLGVLPDPSGLLAAILGAPDDDTPRLVYADWLDEQGATSYLRCRTCGGGGRVLAESVYGYSRAKDRCDGCGGTGLVPTTAVRAALIRAQAEWSQEPETLPVGSRVYKSAGSDEVVGFTTYETPNFYRLELGRRAEGLRDAVRGALLSGVPTNEITLEFDRGFLSRVECPWDRWAKGGDELRTREWCPKVVLSDRPDFYNRARHETIHREFSEVLRATCDVAGQPVAAEIRVPHRDVSANGARVLDAAIAQLQDKMRPERVLPARYPGTLFELPAAGR